MNTPPAATSSAVCSPKTSSFGSVMGERFIVFELSIGHACYGACPATWKLRENAGNFDVLFSHFRPRRLSYAQRSLLACSP